MIKITKKNRSAAFSGSLIQQNFGESLDKGYLMWDLDSKEYERVLIPNNQGYTQIKISGGESIEHRVANMRFGNDKKKTKVRVVLQDYKENYSVEKENQIKQLIKDKHGCEIVNVLFEELKRSSKKNDDGEDEYEEERPYEELFLEFLNELNPNLTQEERQDVMELSRQVDKDLEVNLDDRKTKIYSIDSFEVSNLFSFPEKPTLIDFSKSAGVMGIFGENGSGKSNLVRAMILTMFQVELGKRGRSAGNVVNIYTKKNSGYGVINMTINDEKFRIRREVKTTVDKNGKISNSFPVKYSKYIYDKTKDEFYWKDEESDENTTENKEIKKQIVSAIGTFDEFSKISLHLQSGEGDFIKEDQQPKNDLIRKFMGLDTYDQRYDYANESFKEIKKKQKELGEKESVIEEIKVLSTEIYDLDSRIKTLSSEVGEIDSKIIHLGDQKLALTSNIEKLERLEFNDVQTIESMIVMEQKNITESETKLQEVNQWLSTNFLKEIPFDSNDTVQSLDNELRRDSDAFQRQKSEYISSDSWLKSNPKLIITHDVNELQTMLSSKNSILLNYNNQLAISRGEQCPTCKTITRQADQYAIDNFLNLIQTTRQEILNIESLIKSVNQAISHNHTFDINTQKLETLKGSLTILKNKMDDTARRKKIVEDSSWIIEHNNTVKNNNLEVGKLNTTILNGSTKISKLLENKSKLLENKIKAADNSKIEGEINQLSDEIYSLRINMQNMNSMLNELRYKKRDIDFKVSDLNVKLNKIMISDRDYKKYSLFLQVVHRDGIPAKIIRQNLPIINSKINNLLMEVVDFKIEIVVNKNGDLMEYFYFNEDKSDMLPVYAFSGSQGFLAALAVKVALQYVSNFVKPSMMIIDEGFGTLDKNIIHEFPRVFDYLRTKFKNVLVTTHVSEIKDFVDHSIEVSKTKVGVTRDGFDKHPKAWVSSISQS